MSQVTNPTKTINLNGVEVTVTYAKTKYIVTSDGAVETYLPGDRYVVTSIKIDGEVFAAQKNASFITGFCVPLSNEQANNLNSKYEGLATYRKYYSGSGFFINSDWLADSPNLRFE